VGISVVARIAATVTSTAHAMSPYSIKSCPPIYGALHEVADALAVHTRTREQRGEEEKLVHALSESVRLSNLRYRGGLDSYLQVLDSERDLFAGQLTLAQLRLVELQSVVQLYRALGGGWQ